MESWLAHTRYRGAHEANLVTASLKSRKTYEVAFDDLIGMYPGISSLLPQLESNDNEEKVIIESEFIMQSLDLGTEVGKDFFNTESSVAI